MKKTLLWFRQDLRLTDNPALSEAIQHFETILPIYIHDTHNLGNRHHGAAQTWWLEKSLMDLNQRLGGNLRCFEGDPLTLIPELMREEKIDAICWNRCYEPQRIARDATLKKKLMEESLEVHTFNGSLLMEPWAVKNKAGEYFKVFTPYWRHVQANYLHTLSPSPPKNWEEKLTALKNSKAQHIPKLFNPPAWSKKFEAHWAPGEKNASQLLNGFFKKNIKNYADGRDFPSLETTTKLSPYLHFGEISPRQIWQVAKNNERIQPHLSQQILKFLSELGWREFSYHLLYHFPELPKKSFKKSFEAFPWKKNKKLLQAWQEGKTGYPIIDAGLRQLWETGWMHNRVRMIAASFLIKHCQVDWREGEAWFWDTLLDADLANNTSGWQWVAGSGADASPYYRIFNPILQSKKFDPEGRYIKHWVSELKHLPTDLIHEPWLLSEKDRGSYPLPIVNHEMGRSLALEAYKNLKTEK